MFCCDVNCGCFGSYKWRTASLTACHYVKCAPVTSRHYSSALESGESLCCQCSEEEDTLLMRVQETTTVQLRNLGCGLECFAWVQSIFTCGYEKSTADPRHRDGREGKLTELWTRWSKLESPLFNSCNTKLRSNVVTAWFNGQTIWLKINDAGDTRWLMMKNIMSVI